MKKIFFFSMVLAALALACVGSVVTPTIQPKNNRDADTPSPESPREAVPSHPSNQAERSSPESFKPISDLGSDVIFQITYSSGGAGCAADTIGISRNCSENTNGPVSLHFEGAYRQSAQDEESLGFWWGDKMAQCYDQLEFGDMIYFTADGFEKGEMVTYTIEGPLNKVVYKSTVGDNLEYDGSRCTQQATTPAARLEWVVDPDLGAGTYTITAEGKSGQVKTRLEVGKSSVPAFGATFGQTQFPLTLGSDQQIHLVYTGFEPNQTVTTLLHGNLQDPFGNAPALRYLKTQVDSHGNATLDVAWDPSLPDGIYWLIVPELLPKQAAQQQLLEGFWGIKFYTPGRFEEFFEKFQDIVLRPSCGERITAKAGQVIHLKYGLWGANGQDLLDTTKDKISTRLYVADFNSRWEDREIRGYRSGSYLPMSQIPCGSNLTNGYFLYSETQIGPYFTNSDDEIKIRVEYSFTDSITDGYDFTPADGAEDLYGPDTPFAQIYTIKIVP